MNRERTDAVLAAIDAAVTPTCGHCTQPIPTDGVSDWFCGPDCQRKWAAAHHSTGQLPAGNDDLSGIDDTMVWAPNAAARRADAQRQLIEQAARNVAERERKAADRRAWWESLTPQQQQAERQRWAEETRAMLSAIGEGYTAAMGVLVQAFRPLAESVKRMQQQFIGAGAIAEPAPEDPRERALWLLRNRNTGPQPGRRRAPRNITPTRTR